MKTRFKLLNPHCAARIPLVGAFAVWIESPGATSARITFTVSGGAPDFRGRWFGLRFGKEFRLRKFRGLVASICGFVICVCHI